MDRRMRCTAAPIYVILLISASYAFIPGADGPISHQEALEGGSTTLLCDTTAHSSDDEFLILVWYKNSIPIYSYEVPDREWSEPFFNTSSRLLVDHRRQPSSLTICALTEEDQALYHCRVDFRLAPTRNLGINLTVVVLPSPPFFMDEVNNKVENKIGPYHDGDTLVLKCLVIGEREHEDTQIRSEVHVLVENDNSSLLSGVQTRQPEDQIITPPELNEDAIHEVGNSVAHNENLASLALSGEDSESANMVLDSTILELLGEDPTVSCSYGPEIQKDLAVRLEHIATHGLTKEIKKELYEKYLIPGNCKLIDAPAMNPEMKVAISDITAKRDRNIEFRQKHNATAISCLGQVMTKLFASKNTDPSITRMVMDTQRILCDIQYQDSSVRRSFVLAALKREMKEQIQNTKPDSLLFGQELGEILKAAKAVNKSGTELKIPATKAFQHKPNMRQNSTKNLNWRGPYPPRKPPNHPYHPKAKGPPQPNNNRPYRSSKASPRQQQHQRSHR